MIDLDPAITAHLRAQGVQYCLIGGFALAAYGYPRYTADVDLLTTDRRVLDETFWHAVARKPEIRRGDDFDPLLGVVRWTGELPVDLIVTGNYAAKLAVDSATPNPARIPVAPIIPLILLKLEAGGAFDLDDIARLLEVQAALGHPGLKDQVVPHLPHISEAARAAWPKVLRRLDD